MEIIIGLTIPFLGTALGAAIVFLLRDGISNQVIGVRQARVFHMPIEEALKAEHAFRHDLYNLVNDIDQR